MKPLLPLFALSGAASLIYETLWVRQFGNVFGNTTLSASLVVAVFMCGLGLGGALAGRWVDRQHAREPLAPLRVYARVEFAIAALALLNAFLLPRMVDGSAALSSYTLATNGWHLVSAGSMAARYAVATALLLPITTLMGATLTLLIRYAVANDVSLAGYRIGLLYAANTLGAAAGCFLTDLVLVPTLGVHGTQLLAVLANLVAGLGALRVLARSQPAPSVEAVETVDGTNETGPVVMVGAAIFLSGFATMGMEIVWFRHLSSLFGGSRAVFSVVLTTILLGIVVGSTVGGWLQQRLGRPMEIFFVAQAAFAVATMGTLFFNQQEFVGSQIAPHRELFLSASELTQRVWQLALQFKPMVLLVGFPAALMGCTFPVANACVQRTVRAVGRTAGSLYLANTVGGVAGSLVTGFVLLPALGSQSVVSVLSCITAASLVPMWWAMRGARPKGAGVTLSASLGAIALATAWWLALDARFLIMKSLPQVRSGQATLLDVTEATTELVAVTQVGNSRDLLTNGHAMSSTHTAAQRYMRAFAHIPLLMMEAPERVLVICFGVGNTLHAASLHPSVKELEVADLSSNVLSHAHWFAGVNHDVLLDSRVQVFVNDGRQHLRMSAAGSFDLVTLEPPPINFAGVSALYSTEFYALARTRLKPGGYMTQWLPAYQVSGDVTLSIIRAFTDVFPNAILLSGHKRELILMGRNAETLELDPARLAAALADRPAVHEDLVRLSLGDPSEIVATFAASAETLRLATADASPVSDDFPVMEYSTPSDYVDTRIPAELFDTRGVTSWCPACFSNGQPVASMAGLPLQLELLSQYYRTERFLSTHTFAPLEERPVQNYRVPNAALPLIEHSTYLQSIFQLAPAL